MTRQQFIDEMYDIGDLVSFCADRDLDFCDDIIDEDSRDYQIDDYKLAEWARDNDWETVYRILDEIPTGYNYYRYDEYSDSWEGLTDSDFDDLKEDILEWMDRYEEWDEEEYDGDEEPAPVTNIEPDEDDEDCVPEEGDFPVPQLICELPPVEAEQDSDTDTNDGEGVDIEELFTSVTAIDITRYTY